MIGIPLGLVAANATEWVVHKHLLHNRGKNKSSFWHFHWGEHHGAVRRSDHVDPAYERSVFGWHAQGKEAAALLVGSALLAPLFPVAPWFVGTMWASGLYYHHVHRRSHLDAAWARKHLPWHYDHHMGPDSELNWCVSWPWFDWVMGTRKPYVGTQRDADDQARRLKRGSAPRSARSDGSA